MKDKESWLKEKTLFLKEGRAALKILAAANRIDLLILMQEILDRAATANSEEWKKERYMKFWQKMKPLLYA